MAFTTFYLALAAAYVGCALAATAPTANISAGTLTGGTCDRNPDAVYFKSIPYAKPPVGDLRLEPPQAYTASYPNHALDATSPAPACIQFGGGVIAETKPWSEDCLYLDIWSPANATKTSSLPVRIWLYGGANSYGGISDPVYDGCNVPDTGAIMVALNYRVGPLGFLAVKDADIQGNQGIQDVLLGLEWVKRNIASFGGDPDKVMLHGQSAGATDTFTVASLPQAPKLIKAAILESGGGRDIPLTGVAEYQGLKFAQALGCNANDTACLKSVPVSSYLNVSATLPLLNDNPLPNLGLSSINGYGYGPYVDGNIVPQQPSEVGVKVPSIFGATSLEGSLFALIQFFNGTGISVNASDYDLFLLSNFGETFVSTIKQYYPLSDFASYPYPAFYAISYVIAQASYVCSAERGVQTAAKNDIPVWMYYFDHAPTCSWYPGIPQSAVPLLQAAHTAEIPFVMGDTSGLPNPNGTCNMTSDEVIISNFLNTAWTNMALNGTPGDNASWPQYKTGQPLTLDIKNQTGVEAINQTRCELWNQIDAFQKELAANGTLGGANSTSVVNATSASGGSGSNSSSSAAGASSTNSADCTKSFGGWLAVMTVVAAMLAFL